MDRLRPQGFSRRLRGLALSGRRASLLRPQGFSLTAAELLSYGRRAALCGACLCQGLIRFESVVTPTRRGSDLPERRPELAYPARPGRRPAIDSDQGLP